MISSFWKQSELIYSDYREQYMSHFDHIVNWSELEMRIAQIDRQSAWPIQSKMTMAFTSNFIKLSSVHYLYCQFKRVINNRIVSSKSTFRNNQLKYRGLPFGTSGLSLHIKFPCCKLRDKCRFQWNLWIYCGIKVESTVNLEIYKKSADLLWIQWISSYKIHQFQVWSL